MNTPTYKEQFDKLTRAYIEDRVNPFADCACFVGNLLNNNGRWGCERYWGTEGDILNALEKTRFSDTEIIRVVLLDESASLYTPDEIILLERMFLRTFKDNGGSRDRDDDDKWDGEEALFVAFQATLDLLKQIHISKGEVIDETPKFSKRVLSKTEANV